jgi:hypothetical protein
MEQLKPVVYRFSGFACLEDGSREELSVEISAPEDSGEGDSVCALSCPFLRTRPFSIFGVDRQQALELSRRFVEASLDHMNARLVDADGKTIALPPVPTLDP